MQKRNVCFSHRTAFQILRYAQAAQVSCKSSRATAIPFTSPDYKELEEVLQQLRRLIMSLLLDLPVHVLVKESDQRKFSPRCKEHVCSGQLLSGSLCKLDEGICLTCPELTLVNVAESRKDLVSVLELIYEICGTYQTAQTGAEFAYNVKPLSSVRSIRQYVLRDTSLRGSRKVLSALKYATDNSASVRETKLALLLGLPHAYGGYGLGIPCMNFRIDATKAARALTGKTFFRGDLCWPEAHVDVEYQSREAHEGEASRINDSRRENALAAMGWTVIAITNSELDSLSAMNTIANTVRRHLGIRSQVRVKNYHARKLKLRRQLCLPIENEDCFEHSNVWVELK